MGVSRIRYMAHQDPALAQEGWKQSRHLYTGKENQQWRVYINESTFEFKLINTVTYDTVSYGNKTRNLNVLKRKVRQAMTEVGIELITDVRKKRNAKKELTDNPGQQILPQGKATSTD